MRDFRETESKILQFWRDNKIFEKTLENRKKAKRFVFFEGPPTANGKPGIHHFLGRAFKDLYCRYKTMRGFFVLRKAGWDTHGLPVEIEVEKELGFKNKKDIENYGIGKFNKKARESVWKYKQDWEEMTRRMGFWLDMDDPYITYNSKYIETLWYIIQQIWNKKLLYLAHKVVPFCTRCGTPLSSHEVAQGYKTVIDKSVTVKFLISNSEFLKKLKTQNSKFKTYILAWTTTPWTLPGNVALAVGKDIDYAIVKKGTEAYVIAKDLITRVLDVSYKKIGEVKGLDLVGIEYEPLFDIKELKSPLSYKIYDADFVSTEDGTGVVHTAVMYGEDDYSLGTKLGLPKFHTVDESGKFINVGSDFDGLIVKHKDKPTEEKTTKKIIDYLLGRGLILKTEEYEHDYPFCWRCDSPLLYYAKSSWFIKMSAVRDQLLKNNQKVNWFPEHLKEGRFGQWLKEGKDWAFSRERYWGTPLPIWKCQKCGEHKAIGSVDEMEKSAVEAVAKRNSYYVLRHGYTTRDERNEMIISSDIRSDRYSLTEEGQKQIEKAAQSIKNNYDIDMIYTSPFRRTMESAGIVAKLLHLKIHKDERLKEIDHGGCDGLSHHACPSPDKKREIDYKSHEMGESWNDVRRRVFDFVNEMETKYFGKKILIVSHGDPLWLLNCIAEGATDYEIVDNQRVGRFHYPNIAELRELNWRLLPRNEGGELDLHRPFIDSVSLKCDECGALMRKVPDLIDVWFDSGAMPYAQWHWPFENKKIFEEQFPADFISEAIDQTRGWFYTLLAVSTLLGKGNPYKNLICYSHVLDDKGKKMSKSKGNVFSPFEVMDKVGADTARWYFYTLNQPGEYKLFAIRDVEAKLKGFTSTLENCVRFYELYSSGTKASAHSMKAENLLDKWILSKLHRLIGDVTNMLDSYDPTTATRAVEKFIVEDLSNWWLRRSRKRKEALGLLRFLLLELAKVLAPFTPFLAEDIHARMHKGHKMDTESVHLHDWPKADKKMVNKKLEEEMVEVRSIVTIGLWSRKEKQMKVRQPLRSVTVKRATEFYSDLERLIKEELNIKKIFYNNRQEEAVVLDTELDRSLIDEGYARELIRQMQDIRKEAKYRLDEKVFGQWHSDDSEVSVAINEWTEEIKKEVLLNKLVAGENDKKVYDIEKEFELAPQKKIWIGVRR